MYLALSAFALYELNHLGVLPASVYVHSYVLANCFFGYMLWVYPDSRRTNFALLLIGTVGSIAVVGTFTLQERTRSTPC